LAPPPRVLAAQQGYAVAVNYASNSLAADEMVRQHPCDNGGSAITVQADVACGSAGALHV
jgi:hypothetical protein